MADLDEIMSGSGGDSATEQQPAHETEQAARDDGRDEHGRFASQQPAEQQPATQEQRPPEGYVPIQALDARLAKERERYETQLQQRDMQIQQYLRQQAKPPEAPKPPPDIFENPDAAIDYRLQQAMQPVQQGQQNIVENFSRMMASDKHGEEAVNAAYAEMQNRMQSNPRGAQFDYQRIMASPHPYGELVKWHKSQAALSTYGDDPTAYREKLRAELMAEMQGGQQQAPQTQQPPVMPTSFAGARNAGPSTAPAFSGPRPLSEIMGGR